jgi:hypothetical protein
MKCVTGVAMGTKITMNRLAAELCGVPAASLKNMGDKLVLPSGDLQGFSILKVDPKTNSVYGTFSSGTKILGPGVYDFTALTKWAKGKHHHCYVKLSQGNKNKGYEATPKALPRSSQGKKRKAKEGSTKARQPIGMCMDEGYLSYYFIYPYILNNMYKHILFLNDFRY